MADLQRVPAPRVPFGGRGEFAVTCLLVVVFVLILKPWGPAPGSLDTVVRPTPSADARPPDPTSFEAGYGYDQSIFGPFEPNPEWSVWPGGFFVTVLYVTRETDVTGTQVATPAPGQTATPAPLGPDTPPATSGWPASITIGPGDHLLWLGLDTPREFTVREVAVWRTDPGGRRTQIPVVELPSQWGPHFTIIGIPVVLGSERLTIWPMGSYDVEVVLDPDGSTRTLGVEIQTLEGLPIETPDISSH